MKRDKCEDCKKELNRSSLINVIRKDMFYYGLCTDCARKHCELEFTKRGMGLKHKLTGKPISIMTIPRQELKMLLDSLDFTIHNEVLSDPEAVKRMRENPKMKEALSQFKDLLKK